MIERWLTFIVSGAGLLGIVYLVIQGLRRKTSDELNEEDAASPARQQRQRHLEAWQGTAPTVRLQPRIPGPDESPTILFQSPNRLEILALQERLEAAGIICLTHTDRQLDPATLQYHPNDSRIVVWSADADRARRIIDRLLSTDPATL